VTDGSRLGSLSITVTRPDPQVALIEAASPTYRELFYVVAGERMLTVTAYDATDLHRREPRVHVLRKPPDWEMTPPDGRVTAADDQYLLLQIWELVGIR
jgi:hypothetical protein